MARTLLFSRVLHAFRLLRSAEQAGVPVDEYAGQ